MLPWRDFANNLGQNAIRTVFDMKVAESARDNQLSVPEGNMFTALPSQTVQPIANSHSALGLPFSFTTPEGRINYKAVAGVVIGGLLVLKVLK